MCATRYGFNDFLSMGDAHLVMVIEHYDIGPGESLGLCGSPFPGPMWTRRGGDTELPQGIRILFALNDADDEAPVYRGLNSLISVKEVLRRLTPGPLNPLIVLFMFPDEFGITTYRADLS
jgi:hypothetical protein